MTAADTPAVTIVMATRNCAACLDRCLASIARNRGTATEVVAVDGASTDGTVARLQTAEGIVDRWISEPDNGIYDAFSKGIRLARGRRILFLGADDALLEGFSAAVSAAVEPDVIYYGDVIMTARGRRYDGAFDAAKLARRNICQQAILYPRALFDHHAFNPAYRLQADWALNIACWADPAWTFRHLPVAIAEFDDRSGASSRSTDWAFWWDYPRLLQDCLPAAAIRLPLLIHALSRGYRLIRGPAAARARRHAFLT